MRLTRRLPGGALAALLVACACSESRDETTPRPATDEPTAETVHERQDERRAMVAHLRDVYGFDDERVLAAMERVPRHRFVPDALRSLAYRDGALPIEHGQTISQPYVVASMTAAAGVDADSRVLEVGTGSGYQAAVLAELVDEVHTIEIVEPLGERAREILDDLGYDNVHVRIGDGYRGWPEAAPFDAILVTAAPDHVPEPLKEQLRIGGRLVLPVGDLRQELMILTRTENGFEERKMMDVRFVPMTGEAEEK